MAHEDEILESADRFAVGGDFGSAWERALAGERRRMPVGVWMAAAAVLLVLGRSVWSVSSGPVEQLPVPPGDPSAASGLPTPAGPTEPEPSVAPGPVVREEGPDGASVTVPPTLDRTTPPELPPGPPVEPEDPGTPGPAGFVVDVTLEYGVAASSAEVNCHGGQFRERVAFVDGHARMEGVPAGECFMVLVGAGNKRRASFQGDALFSCGVERTGVVCRDLDWKPRPIRTLPPMNVVPEELAVPEGTPLVPVLFERSTDVAWTVQAACGEHRVGSVLGGRSSTVKVPAGSPCDYLVISPWRQTAFQLPGAAVVHCVDGAAGLVCEAEGLVPLQIPEPEDQLGGEVLVVLTGDLKASSMEVSCEEPAFRARATFQFGQALLAGVPMKSACTMRLVGAGSKKGFPFVGSAGFTCTDAGGELSCR